MINQRKLDVNTIFEIAILVIMIVFSFLFCINQFFDHDEFEAVHTTWKLIQGQTMYIDFFQQKPPFFHITMIPFVNLLGETINALMSCKIYMYVLFLGIVYCSHFISKRVFGYKTRYLTPIIILSCTVFTDKLTEIRPDTLYIMLIMLSLAFFYKDIRIKKTSLIASAIFAGLSFSVLPKAAFYIIPVAVILTYRFFIKKISLNDIFLYFVVFIFTITPFFIYFLSKSISLEQYWFYNFTINFNLISGFSPRKTVVKLFYQNWLLYILSIVSIFLLKGHRQKEIAFIAIFLYFSVFTINSPNFQYFAPAIPFLAMMAAYTITKIKFVNQWTYTVLLIIIIPSISYFHEQATTKRNIGQLNQIRYVLENTNKDDYVYDGSIYFNIFRHDVDYFWFSVRPRGAAETCRNLKPREYNIYKDIEEKKPKIIYVKYLDINNPVIKDTYLKTRFNRMYIRRNNNEYK